MNRDGFKKPKSKRLILSVFSLTVIMIFYVFFIFSNDTGSNQTLNAFEIVENSSSLVSKSSQLAKPDQLFWLPSQKCNLTVWQNILYKSHLVGLIDTKPASLKEDGCGLGFSANLSVNVDESELCFQNHKTPSLRAMIKSVKFADESLPNSESHLREIIFSALDRVLETNIALPTVGRWLNLRTLQRVHNHEVLVPKLYKYAACLIQNDRLPVSVNMWASSPVENITFNISQAIDSPELFRYVLINFIGGCFRTLGNVFKARDVYLAIDNDRCFHYDLFAYSYLSDYWQLLLEPSTCAYVQKNPLYIRDLLIQLRQLLDEGRGSLLPRITAELVRDPLADLLLQDLVGFYKHVDARVHTVVNHFIHTCPMLSKPQKNSVTNKIRVFQP